MAVAVGGGFAYLKLERLRDQRRHRRAVADIDRLERELEMGSHATRLETVSAVQRRKLRREVEDARQRLYDEQMRPRAGKALRQRKRLGKPTVEGYLASLSPRPYMQRLKQIESQTADHRRRLEDRWWELAEEHQDDPLAFEQAWLQVAGGWSFDELNALIDEHNRNYPA